LLHKEGLSRRKMESYVPTLVRGLLALHVGVIAIVGMRKAHLQATHLPQFYLALEWLKASGIGVVGGPGHACPEARRSVPLCCATEAATFIDSYDDRDLANLALHWYALLERDEPQPQASWRPSARSMLSARPSSMIFRELHHRLDVERLSMEKATANIEADACAARKRQNEREMEIVPYTDGQAYRDWLPFDTVIEELRPPRSGG
jgi:hypothetical protein